MLLATDNRGYSYNLKRNVAYGRDLQCVVRQKDLYCMASVKERGNNCFMGKHRHCHEGAPGVSIVKKITATVKDHSVSNDFESVGAIAERALYSMGDANLPPQICRPRNVYRKETRTNNDCEGWHRRTNRWAMEIAQPMYYLIPIIFSEAEILQSRNRL